MIVTLVTLHTGSAIATATAPVHAEVRGIAKSSDARRFVVANEAICGRIGQLLGLPVPPGTVCRFDGTPHYYFSLNVCRELSTPPPIDAVALARDMPQLAAGIVLFDVLVANTDRHAGNLIRDPAEPTFVALIDHSHALFGPGQDGLAQLGAAHDRLRCENHCLLGNLTSEVDLLEWCGRISALPDFQLEDACTQARDDGVLEATFCEPLIAWLKARRGAIVDLVREHKDAFTGIEKWSLFLDEKPQAPPGATAEEPAA